MPLKLDRQRSDRVAGRSVTPAPKANTPLTKRKARSNLILITNSCSDGPPQSTAPSQLELRPIRSMLAPCGGLPELPSHIPPLRNCP